MSEVGVQPRQGLNPTGVGLRYSFQIELSMASTKEKIPIVVHPEHKMNLPKCSDLCNSGETVEAGKTAILMRTHPTPGRFIFSLPVVQTTLQMICLTFFFYPDSPPSFLHDDFPKSPDR